MRENWRTFCKLSIVHFQAFPECVGGEGPFIETVTQIARDTFFDAIEMGWITNNKQRHEVKKILEASSMEVIFCAHPALITQKLNLNSTVDNERNTALAQLISSIDEAKDLGAKKVVFLSGQDPGDQNREEAFDVLVESVTNACIYAENKGIRLICETFDREVDKKCLIGPSKYAVKFAKRIKLECQNFGLLYDLSHQPLLFEDPEAALQQLKDYLDHVHVGNCVLEPGTIGYGDTHPRFGWPGGFNNIPEIVQFLRGLFDIGYLHKDKHHRPLIGFEIKPQTNDESIEQILAGTKRVWEEAWYRL